MAKLCDHGFSLLWHPLIRTDAIWASADVEEAEYLASLLLDPSTAETMRATAGDLYSKLFRHAESNSPIDEASRQELSAWVLRAGLHGFNDTYSRTQYCSIAPTSGIEGLAGGGALSQREGLIHNAGDRRSDDSFGQAEDFESAFVVLNPSLLPCRDGKVWRYIQCKGDGPGKESSVVVEVESDDAFEICAAVASKAVQVGHLSSQLAERLDVSHAEAAAYVGILVDDGALVVSRTLPPDAALQIKKVAEGSARSVHPDSIRRQETAVLPAAIVAALANASSIALKLFGTRPEAFETYKQRFLDRFGHEEVLLLSALSYGDEALPLPTISPEGSTALLSESAAAYLFKKLVQSKTATGFDAIVISVDDIDGLLEPEHQPKTMGLWARAKLLRQSTVANGSFQPIGVLEGVGGITGLEPLMAYADLHPEMGQTCASFTKAENIGLAFACVDDAGSSGSAFSAFIETELVICEAGRAPREKQIWISDLTVQLNRDGFVLRDRRSGRRVIPVISSSGSGRWPANIKEFFECILHGSSTAPSLRWPSLFQGFEHLPSVYCEGFLILPAQWRIPAAVLESLVATRPTPEDVGRWRASLRLPRFVLAGSAAADTAPVDLRTCTDLERLVAGGRSGVVTLFECAVLNWAYESKTQDPKIYEVVVPFSSEVAHGTEGALPQVARQLDFRHKSSDAWISIKLFVEPAKEEWVVAEVLAPAFAALTAGALVEKYFYSRHSSEWNHIELRLLPGPNRLAMDACLRRLCALGDNHCWRISQEISQPQYARYGARGWTDILLNIFGLQSGMASQIIAGAGNGAAAADHAWLHTIISLDHHATDIARLVRGGRKELIEGLCGMGVSPDANQTAVIQLRAGDLYRKSRKEVDAILVNRGPLAGRAATAMRQLEVMREPMQRAIGQLREQLEQAGGPQAQDLSTALLLMRSMANKLLPARFRQREVECYEFIRRLDSARAAGFQTASPPAII